MKNVLHAFRPSEPANLPSRVKASLAAAFYAMRSMRVFFGIMAALAILPPGEALAQNYSIDWYKIAGGGGTSTGGVYSVSGTIGQHDAGGPMTGGSYSLTGGFWAFISVLQTAGAPVLHISHSGSSVIVYWQAVAGWNLQQNGNVNAPSGWSASSGITSANGTNTLTIASPAGKLFFRLSKN